MGHFLGTGGFSLLEMDGVLRLLVAAILGMALGFERSVAGKHAGMRTYALVSLGSCLFVIVGTIASYELSFFSGINPLQIAGSVVLGIGFIGTGLAAFRGTQNQPVEITTASGIWVAAGIGMAAGFGLYTLGIATTLIAIVIFSVFMRIEHHIRVRYGERESEYL
ncbi:MAG: MgtC/SapB family protein [Patescibacteria group bacterium]|nr:MgtC/SapB family protein [Patescibacteria group bacterium]